MRVKKEDSRVEREGAEWKGKRGKGERRGKWKGGKNSKVRGWTLPPCRNFCGRTWADDLL